MLFENVDRVWGSSINCERVSREILAQYHYRASSRVLNNLNHPCMESMKKTWDLSKHLFSCSIMRTWTIRFEEEIYWPRFKFCRLFSSTNLPLPSQLVRQSLGCWAWVCPLSPSQFRTSQHWLGWRCRTGSRPPIDADPRGSLETKKKEGEKIFFSGSKQADGQTDRQALLMVQNY